MGGWGLRQRGAFEPSDGPLRFGLAARGFGGRAAFVASLLAVAPKAVRAKVGPSER